MRRRKMITVKIMDDASARRVASVMGPNSAFARALDEITRRRAAGEVLSLVRSDSAIFIGPTAELIAQGIDASEEGEIAGGT